MIVITVAAMSSHLCGSGCVLHGISGLAAPAAVLEHLHEEGLQQLLVVEPHIDTMDLTT